MSFRWYIYYCALFGGCAAYLGWALGRAVGVQHHVWQASLRGMLLGVTVAVVLTFVDLLWHLAGRDAAGTAARIFVAGVVGGLGGFVGGFVGQILYAATERSLFLIAGWAITGVLIGAAPGLFDLFSRLARNEDATHAGRKVFNGVLGGTLGGLAGGLVFLAMRGLWGLILGDRADQFLSPSATGFVALGLLIGLMIGLAQVILKTAWITVVAGFRQGRELMLSRDETVIGRAEGCDVPLFGDAEAEKRHARITLRGGSYYLEDLDSPGGTYLNGERLSRASLLRSGDLIEVGRSALRFGERVKRGESA
jgi:hypothetical protein